MAASLFERKLMTQRHVCCFFSSAEQRDKILRPYVREGVRRNHKGLHVLSPDQKAVHDRVFAPALRAGKLEVHDWRSVYFSDGKFSADRMMKTLESTLRANRAAGFAKTRTIGDMGWAASRDVSKSEMIAYEARVNLLNAAFDDLLVCVYDVSLFDGQTIVDILATHPLVLMEDVLQENPFYVPPRTVLRRLSQRSLR